MRSTSVATLKKLSARKKNPVLGRRAPRTTRRSLCRDDSETFVENRKFWLPPSGLNPAAIAIASISVDFPLPFSPTRNVTFGCSASVASRFTAGIENG